MQDAEIPPKADDEGRAPHTSPENSETIDADRRVVDGKVAPSKRTRLSRARIVSSAIDFIDENDLPTLTMRRLGERLGVEAMALYRYVPGREDLLDAIVGAVIDEMRQDDDVLGHPEDGWQDFLQRLAHGVRRIALRHPRVFPLVASRPPEAPWLRPPLRSLWWVEMFIAGLRAEGFDDTTVVYAYRSFTGFLLGHLLLEVSHLGADLGPLDVLEGDQQPDDNLASEFPNVARLRSALSQDNSAVEFEEALEELINRIALALRGQDS